MKENAFALVLLLVLLILIGLMTFLSPPSETTKKANSDILTTIIVMKVLKIF